MKKWIILIIILVLVLIGARFGYKALTEDSAAEEVEMEAGAVDEAGTPAADFTVYDIDGNEVRLSDRIGKKTLINFWATWCPPCCAELPYMQKAYEERGDEIDFMFVDLTDGVSETEETVKAFLEDNGYTFPVYYDSDASAVTAYGITGIPATYIIDEDGNVTAAHVGSMSEAEIESLLTQ